MDEQKKEVSAQVQPETAETLQTDEINEQTCLLYTSPSPRDRG